MKTSEPVKTEANALPAPTRVGSSEFVRRLVKQQKRMERNSNLPSAQFYKELQKATGYTK
jgi:hypothetical protein